MTRVTAPVVRPISSASRPAVAAPVSISSSSASMSDSDRPSRMATVWPKNEPWKFTRRRARTTESTRCRRSMVDKAPRLGNYLPGADNDPNAERRKCRRRQHRARGGSEMTNRTSHQRPDDRDPRPAADVQVARRRRSRPCAASTSTVERRRDLRLPRPERGRQDDDPADAGDAAAADARGRDRRRRRPGARAADGPPADRLRAAGRLDRPGRDRPRRARPPGPAVRHGQGDRPGARGRGPRRARPRGGRRPADRHVLGRHAAPARRRARHRPPAGRPVPRRADDRPRPAGPRPDVGRDPRASARAARPSS